jgi:hypothetical protein
MIKHRFEEPKEHYQDDDGTSTNTMKTPMNDHPTNDRMNM